MSEIFVTSFENFGKSLYNIYVSAVVKLRHRRLFIPIFRERKGAVSRIRSAKKVEWCFDE